MSTVSRNIGTQILFENDLVRVWDMTLGPGESSELHQHAHDYLFVYVTPTQLEIRERGREPVRRSYDDGFVQHTVVGHEGLTPHQIRNIGDGVHRQVLVEFLGESASPHPLEPETNGRFL